MSFIYSIVDNKMFLLSMGLRDRRGGFVDTRALENTLYYILYLPEASKY